MNSETNCTAIPRISGSTSLKRTVNTLSYRWAILSRLALFLHSVLIWLSTRYVAVYLCCRLGDWQSAMTASTS